MLQASDVSPFEREFMKRPYTRFDKALMIQQGAANMRGVSRSLVEACDEARECGVQPGLDPAVQLILHQLCHLAHILTSDMPADSSGFNWDRAYAHCCEHACMSTLMVLADHDEFLREQGRLAEAGQRDFDNAVAHITVVANS